MSKDLNNCSFIGRLGRDIELKYTASNSAIANFSIACGDDYKDKQGQKVEQTNWIYIVAFGKLAEIIGQYVTRGMQIYISGKQVTRKWQDGDGNDRYSTEIIANDMQMLGGRSGAQNENQTPQSKPGGAQPPVDDFMDDEIPFISCSMDDSIKRRTIK